LDLTGKTAVITGGGRGVGAAAAYALTEAGATVAVAARNEEQVVEVAAQLRSRGYEAFAFRCDVTDPRQVRDLALSSLETMAKVDILINNASTATSNPLHGIKLTEWDHIVAVNATGTFLCTQAMYPGMVARGWGRVVKVAAIVGIVGGRDLSAYSAAEHAVVGFTKAVAQEAEGTGVTVNAVCPGYVDTPLTDEAVARRMQRTGQTWQEAMDEILEEAGQPRLIRADEVAVAIMPLLADSASETNGQLVVIDGRDGP
jgi:NAD(P)-dependent dehydrogenase (short-subunit alcohol dehydrogenase family)